MSLRAGGLSLPYLHPAGLMAPHTQPRPPQWARPQPAPPASVPSGSPGSTAGSEATRPRPLPGRVASGTVVVVPVALSLPGHHTTTVHAKGLPRQLVALRREAMTQQQRLGGEATERSLAWDLPSLCQLPKNRERREVPGLLRPPGVPTPFLARAVRQSSPNPRPGPTIWM